MQIMELGLMLHHETMQSCNHFLNPYPMSTYKNCAMLSHAVPRGHGEQSQAGLDSTKVGLRRVRTKMPCPVSCDML